MRLNKEEKQLLKAFEEALQNAMIAYFEHNNGLIKNGLGDKYEVRTPVCEDLCISTKDEHMTNVLLTFLCGTSNTQPRLEGHVILTIKKEEDTQYSKIPYFFWISALDYCVKQKEPLLNGSSIEYEVTIRTIEFCIRDEKVHLLIVG